MENKNRNKNDMTPQELIKLLKANIEDETVNNGIGDEYSPKIFSKPERNNASGKNNALNDGGKYPENDTEIYEDYIPIIPSVKIPGSKNNEKQYRFSEKQDALDGEKEESYSIDEKISEENTTASDISYTSDKQENRKNGNVKKYRFTISERIKEFPEENTKGTSDIENNADSSNLDNQDNGEINIDELMKKYLSDDEYEEYEGTKQGLGLSLEAESEPAEKPFKEMDKEEYRPENPSAERGLYEIDDIQKSIREAEDYIYAHEHTDEREKVKYQKSKEKQKQKEEYDETDIWITSIFEDEGEVEKKFGAQEAQKINEAVDMYHEREESGRTISTAKIEEEFTSPSQVKGVFARYRVEHKKMLIKLLVCFGFLIAAFFYENIGIFKGASLPGVLNPAAYPVVYIMIDLQLLVLCCALIWKSLYNGIRALIKLNPIPESMTAVIIAVTFIYHIAISFSGFNGSIRLFNFSVILCVFLTLMFEFLNLKREIFSFNIVSAKKLKYAVVDLKAEESTLENDAFSEYLPKNPSMFKINRVKFVDSFMKRMNKSAKNLIILKAILPLCVIIGMIFWIVAAVSSKSGYAGLSSGYAAFLMCIPFSALFTFSYPFFKASKEAFEIDSAIIGEEALEEYSEASSISFEDKDVFPSYGVKVKSVKVYGDNRIDKILYCASSLFRKVGGPLGDVFDMATLELGHSDNVELIESAPDGLEMTVDGQHVFVGRASYLRENNFMPIYDQDDDTAENSGEVSIMYMVSNDEVVAKMYIQYMIDPDFEFTLRQLYKAGICVGIKTFDPNIDDRLLSMRIQTSKYPVKVLRCRDLNDVSETMKRADSGIVSKNSSRSLLQTLAMCGKVLHVKKTGIVIKVFSVIISILIMIFLLAFGQTPNLSSLYISLYQIFWIIPMYVFAKIYI